MNADQLSWRAPPPSGTSAPFFLHPNTIQGDLATSMVGIAAAQLSTGAYGKLRRTRGKQDKVAVRCGAAMLLFSLYIMVLCTVLSMLSHAFGKKKAVFGVCFKTESHATHTIASFFPFLFLFMSYDDMRAYCTTPNFPRTSVATKHMHALKTSPPSAQRSKGKRPNKPQQPQSHGITKITRQKRWTELQDQHLLLALVRCAGCSLLHEGSESRVDVHCVLLHHCCIVVRNDAP